MDDRSNIPTTETEVAKLTIEQLNTKVAMTEWRFQNASNSSQRESPYLGSLFGWKNAANNSTAYLHQVAAPLPNIRLGR